jgi:hypothetical protein
MTRKCKHPVRQLEVQLDEYLRTQAISCGKCGAVGVYPLFGVSDDLDLHVKHEIAAAEIVARLQTGPHQMTNAEFDGYNSDESSPFADLIGWHIGWLAAEATHDHSDGWAWDVSRPIAEQLAETVRVDAEADDLVALAERALSEPAEFDLQAATAFLCGDGAPSALLDEREAVARDRASIAVAVAAADENSVADAADVTTDDIHSPNCDVLTDAAFNCNCGDAQSAAARLRADIAATAAGEDPVADRLVEELMADILPDEVAS